MLQVNNLISRETFKSIHSTEQRGEITEMKMCLLNKYFCFDCVNTFFYCTNTSVLIIQILLFWSYKYFCFYCTNTCVGIAEHKYEGPGLILWKYSKHRHRERGKYHLKHTDQNPIFTIFECAQLYFDSIWPTLEYILIQVDTLIQFDTNPT